MFREERRLRSLPNRNHKNISLYFTAVLFAIAGLNHFLNPEFYLKIMPPWLPFHMALNIISGVCEIIFAVLLIPRSTRRLAAWGLIALLVAVFPANIQMAINYYNSAHPGFWLTILRLFLQPLLVIWIYKFTKKRDLSS